jgi:hypothetical protein
LAAEVRLAAEQTIDAGMRGSPFVSQPNPIANDPHIDIEILSGSGRVNGAQVGVGKVPYLRLKARRSEADQVIVNAEAREEFRFTDPMAHGRTSDRLQYDETSSKPLRADVVERDSVAVLTDVLSGSERLSRGSIGARRSVVER